MDEEILEQITVERDELLAAARVALQYLDHPDVQVIPFALPASGVAERLRKAIFEVDFALPIKE